MAHPLPEWLSAAEIAALGLPGLPKSKAGVQKRIAAEGWDARVSDAGEPLAQPRRGRGGGMEYHRSLLPAVAVMAAAKAEPRAGQKPEKTAADWWAAWAVASEAQKERARRRADLVGRIEGLKEGLGSLSGALDQVARECEVSRAALHRWRGVVDGCPRDLWAPMLMDEVKGGGRDAAIPEPLWQYYASWWLRLSKPTHADAFRRTAKEAKRLGIADIPSAKTFQRRIEREIPREVVLMKREGWDKARLAIPQQERTVEGLHAMEIVNLDGHKWDVLVQFPDGRIGRPMIVAIQDVFSRKFLAWRIGRDENAGLARLVFADLFREWGIPRRVLTDNSRAFASKWITGGAKNRFRFSIKADDPLGLLPMLGIEVHWATPRRGQVKPIERGFRDFASDIARLPDFDGAWTGNSVANKPENRGQKAIPLERFREIVAAEIAEHNARPARRTEMGAGVHSLDEVFAESYAACPVGRATAEQLELALLTADKVRADRDCGAIRLFGNRYWSPEISHLAGQRVIVRFDPDALHDGVSVYDAQSRFVARVPVWEKTGFLTADAGKARMKAEADLRKAIREQERALNLLSPEALAEGRHSQMEPAQKPAPGAIRPVRIRQQAAAAVAQQPDSSIIEQFSAGIRRLRLVDE